jgi:hypothetical protein
LPNNGDLPAWLLSVELWELVIKLNPKRFLDRSFEIGMVSKTKPFDMLRQVETLQLDPRGSLGSDIDYADLQHRMSHNGVHDSNLDYLLQLGPRLCRCKM